MCELQFISEGTVLYFIPWQGLDTSIYLLQERSKAHFLFAFFFGSVCIDEIENLKK